MSEHEGPWPTGTPCWVDLAVDDLAAARTFYAEVFGWDVERTQRDPGAYLMASLAGRAVAAIGPRTHDDQPVAWTTYLATADADATTAAVTAAGGSVVRAPFEVPGVARIAVVADPTGAAFGLWQARTQAGVERTNVPGAMCWNEVHTDDAGSARAFYADLFGWTYDVFGDPAEPYASAKLHETDAAPIAGVYAPSGGSPDGGSPERMSPYWLTWFGVVDTDATVAAIVERAGAVLMEPHDSPFGRAAVVGGAQGEVFGVIAVPTA
jgi:uncharacterized protein